MKARLRILAWGWIGLCVLEFLFMMAYWGAAFNPIGNLFVSLFLASPALLLLFVTGGEQ